VLRQRLAVLFAMARATGGAASVLSPDTNSAPRKTQRLRGVFGQRSLKMTRWEHNLASTPFARAEAISYCYQAAASAVR